MLDISPEISHRLALRKSSSCNGDALMLSYDVTSK
jgi:hypothetical protein